MKDTGSVWATVKIVCSEKSFYIEWLLFVGRDALSRSCKKYYHEFVMKQTNRTYESFAEKINLFCKLFSMVWPRKYKKAKLQILCLWNMIKCNKTFQLVLLWKMLFRTSIFNFEITLVQNFCTKTLTIFIQLEVENKTFLLKNNNWIYNQEELHRSFTIKQIYLVRCTCMVKNCCHLRKPGAKLVPHRKLCNPGINLKNCCLYLFCSFTILNFCKGVFQ